MHATCPAAKRMGRPGKFDPLHGTLHVERSVSNSPAPGYVHAWIRRGWLLHVFLRFILPLSATITMKSFSGAVSTSALALLALQASGVSADSAKSFVPSNIRGLFVEQFTPDWESRWTPSQASKFQRGAEEFKYDGVWSVEEASMFPGIPGDLALTMKSKAKQHAISTLLDKPIVFDGTKPLVVQYEVKMQNGLSCGGAYVKLLSSSESDLDPKQFADTTPYSIMFGPDRCGPDSKLHFIFRHKNPVSGNVEEKHLKVPPHAKVSKVSTLYTLIVNPDNTFDIQVNEESVLKGNLLEDFSPAVNPPKEIDDPNDSKPEDWVDESQIPDPEAVKPEDWDEDAPAMIADPAAKKPIDWLDEEPLMVPDPKATKPEEWDDEEDGEWIAPPVPNPKCDDVSGCGTWTAPMVANPAYKGKWTPPLIPNPAYKGEWAPRKIANPEYFEDKQPNKFLPIGGIGFELWTMDDDIQFDNIYISNDPKEAAKFADETFRVKLPLEQNREQETNDKDDETVKPPAAKSSLEHFANQIRRRTNVLVERLSTEQDKLRVLQQSSDIVGFYAAVVAVLLGLVGLFASMLGGSSTAAPAKQQPSTKKDEPKSAASTAVKGASSSVQDASANVTKRAAAAAGTQ